MKKYPALFATLVYLAVGSCWIIFSDAAVWRAAGPSSILTAEQMQLFKGLLYVGLTGVLVFLLVRAATRTSRRRADELDARVRERTAELDARNRDLERANRDLTAFSSSVSHDLRAPLRAIGGFAEIVRDRYAEQLPEEGRRYLENVIAAGDRMDGLIEDLLRYARLGTSGVLLEPLTLRPLLERICAEQASAHGLEPGSIVVEDGDCEVLGSRSLLELILSNLVENAIRYRSAQRAVRITVTVSSDSERPVLAVSDNGIGIAASDHEHIFTLFGRLHDDEEGTGIGLAISRRAAEAMGGTLTVTSRPGEGSRFCVTLTGTRAGA